MKVGKSKLKRLFTDLNRKRITDGMMDTLIESVWRDTQSAPGTSGGDILLAENYDTAAIGGILLCSKYNNT